MTSTAEKLDKLMTSKHNLKPQQTAWKEHTSAFKSFLSLEIMFYACPLTVSFYFVNPWTVSHQAPSVHGIFPGKNTGVGCHFLLQGNLPDPVIKPTSPASPELAGRFFTSESPGKPHNFLCYTVNPC